MYDIIIVGSGFCGSVIADLAARKGKRVLLLEKRDHIAGNMYDYMHETGIFVHKYGPHIVHTSNQQVADYLFARGEWYPFKLHYGVEIDGKCLSAPFGFHTIDRFYGADNASKLKRLLKKAYPNRGSASIMELLEREETAIKEFARLLYKKNYLPYALKQWQLPPEKLTDEIIGRMPVIFSERQYYFTDEYEILPRGGYTAFFQKLLGHPLIDVRLNTDATKLVTPSFESGQLLLDGTSLEIPLVYTGPLDEFFFGKSGSMPYRSLSFEFEVFDTSQWQERPIVTYPQRNRYLRTTDYNQFMEYPIKGNTVVGYDFPIEYDADGIKGSEPYYPVLTSESSKKNLKLQEYARRFAWLYPCGRLADFHYYNMDKAVERAFSVFETIVGDHWR